MLIDSVTHFPRDSQVICTLWKQSRTKHGAGQEIPSFQSNYFDCRASNSSKLLPQHHSTHTHTHTHVCAHARTHAYTHSCYLIEFLSIIIPLLIISFIQLVGRSVGRFVCLPCYWVEQRTRLGPCLLKLALPLWKKYFGRRGGQSRAWRTLQRRRQCIRGLQRLFHVENKNKHCSRIIHFLKINDRKVILKLSAVLAWNT